MNCGFVSEAIKTSLSLGPFKLGMHFLLHIRKFMFIYPNDKTVKGEDEKR